MGFVHRSLRSWSNTGQSDILTLPRSGNVQDIDPGCDVRFTYYVISRRGGGGIQMICNYVTIAMCKTDYGGGGGG